MALTRTGAAVAGSVLVLVVLSGCSDGGDDESATATTFVSLDGRPRQPDAEGVLVAVAEDFSTIELDGDRVFDVSPLLQSFSAADGSIQPLIRWQDQYVQVGIEGDAVVWLGGLSSVVEIPGERPRAYVTGVAVDVDDERLVLRSGTVLRLADEVEPPSNLPGAVTLTIDVADRRVVEVAAA